MKNQADALIFHTLVVPQAAQRSLMADGKTPSCFGMNEVHPIANSSGKRRLRNGGGVK